MQTPEAESKDIHTTLGLTPAAPKRVHRMRWALCGTVLIMVLALTVVLIQRNKTPEIQYQTQPAVTGAITATVNATGNLEPTNNVTVGSELSGIIKSVEVEENDTVKSGQVLARLDTRKLSAKVSQSRATLASAKAKVLQSKATVEENTRTLNRLQKAYALSGGKIPSQEALDAAHAALLRAQADEISAQAAVSEAEATLEQDQTDLEKSVIISPINGIILTRDIEPGQTVAASLSAPTLFTIAQDLSRMELKVSVDEADVGRIKKGQQATFSVDAYPDRTFQATIKRVSYGSTTTDGVVTYETVLAVDNSDLILRPGMTATAIITVEKAEGVLLVPNAALRFSPENTDETAQAGNKSMVSRILPRPRSMNKRKSAAAQIKNGSSHQRLWSLENGRPAALDVQTGITNGIQTEVTKGPVKPGTLVIISSTSAPQ